MAAVLPLQCASSACTKLQGTPKTAGSYGDASVEARAVGNVRVWCSASLRGVRRAGGYGGASAEACGGRQRSLTPSSWSNVSEVQSHRHGWELTSGAVRVWSSSAGEGLREEEGDGGDGESGSDEVDWLRENLPLQFEKDGLDVETSARIGDACADACANFFATGRAFDPMMIMDAMEEEVERRDLRGDSLPFEIGRKAAKLLTQRWSEPVRRPKMYRDPFVNKLDVVDFDRFPKNLNLP